MAQPGCTTRTTDGQGCPCQCVCKWFGLRGESPLQVDVLRPVADRNCVAARRGGEHRKANGQSVTQVNSIRPGCSASLLVNGEAQTGAIRKQRKLRGNVTKRSVEQSGGWRRNGRKSKPMKQRDLPGTRRRSALAPARGRNADAKSRRAGVRGPIVALNPGNSGGAKGTRKMDVV